jgi:glycerophosphoryl diester phosphodiesterase
VVALVSSRAETAVNKIQKNTSNSPTRITVHGHRGSRGTHPENTLPAFEEAVKAGADVLELDLQLTRDDIPVIVHDPYIGTLCTDEKAAPVETPIPIRTLSFEQLQKFECGRRGNLRFPEQKRMDGVRIPSLESFLIWAKDNAPRLEFNIETKMSAPDPKHIADPEAFAYIVVSLLKKHGVIKKTILQSFDFRTLKAARKLEPALRLSCLYENQPAFCDPTVQEHATFASPNWQSVTPEEVKRCHDRGIAVVPWTANDATAWAELAKCNVDAIITDYPRKLVEFFAERNRR